MPNALENLHKVKNYPTDKFGNGYYPAYCFHFDKIRLSVKSVLEIGIWAGGSMELWKDYFLNATIVGVDLVKPNYTPTDTRIKLEFGDATNVAFISDLITKYGNFDIVIDDGSHFSSHMRASFVLLWPHTNLIYCIEDLATQYTAYSNGSFLNAPSMIDSLRQMVDDNNMYPSKEFDYKTLCFHPYQCFIYKELGHGEYK